MSGRHRALSLAVTVVLLGGCSLVPGHSPGPTAAPTVPTPHTEAFSPAPGDDGPQTLPSTPAAATAQATAETFAKAWARPDLSAAQWLAGVAPYATPSYRQLLGSVDPARIPARAVTGPATATSSSAVVNVFDIPTDAGVVQITCQFLDGMWLVAGVELRRPA